MVRLARFDALIASIEATRALSRTWTVVDMDQFFAAVAMRDDPSLVGKPIAVGGNAMISTANYTARKFGVRSAMPGFIARELCSSLVFVRSDFDAYKMAAAQMHAIFAEYDPTFRSTSLDEASLDITEIVASCDAQRAALGANRDTAEACGDLSPCDASSPELSPLAASPRAAPHPADVVATIRRRIFDATQLTASAGVAPNKMLAKICSDENKPDGQCVLPPTREAIVAFMAGTRLRRVPGVGKVLEKILSAAFGATLCGELLAPRVGAFALELLGAKTARWLFASCLGVASNVRAPAAVVGPAGDRVGMSLERTFATVRSAAPLRAKLAAYCALLERDLAQNGDGEAPLRAKTFKLIWKTAKFKRGERSRTLPRYICKAADIHAVIAPLLERLLVEVLPPNGPGVRLLGIGAAAWEGTHSASQEGIARYTTSVRSFPRSRSPLVASGGAAVAADAAADAAQDLEEGEGAAGGSGDDSPHRISQTAFSGPECPICGKSIGSGSGLTPTTNSELNEHVDICLNVAALGAVEAEALPRAAIPVPPPTAAAAAAPAAATAAGVPHAVMSAAPMIAPRASPSRQRPSAKRAGAKHFDWQCQSCTMLNPVSKRSCGACRTQRRDAKRARKGDSRGGVRQFFAPQ